MEFDGTVNDSYFWNDFNHSHVVNDWGNVTSEPLDRDYEVFDPNVGEWAVYKNVGTGICLGAIVTNLALLVLIITRAYQYRNTDKWKWARLHFIMALCVDHVIIMTITVVTKFPEGMTWIAQSDGLCKVLTVVIEGLHLAVLPYLIAVAIHTFFQVYHPTALVGAWQFVIFLMVHPIVWIASLVSVYVTHGRSARSFTFSDHGKEERFCVGDDPNVYGKLVILLTSVFFLLTFSYLTFITTVGTCLVRPNQSTDATWAVTTGQSGVVKPDQSTETTGVVKLDQSTDITGVVKSDRRTNATNQDDGLLRWMTKCRVKASIFLAVVTVLALATRLPEYGRRLSQSILGTNYGVAAMRRHLILLALHNVFYLLFPLCCLILQEMGVYSLIKRIRN